MTESQQLEASNKKLPALAWALLNRR